MEAENGTPSQNGQPPNQQMDSDFTFNHPDINRVFIAGTLLHDPPLRRTRKGVPVTNFIVVTKPDHSIEAEEGMEREPLYISVVVWAKQAVQCANHLRKGSAVIILGELQSMPNANIQKNFFPVQVNAQWIQYLDKGTSNNFNLTEEEGDAEVGSDS